MPNHVILDRIWVSDKLAACSVLAQLHYPRLYLLSDDWSCFEIDAAVIRGKAYPKMPKVIPKQIQGWLDEYAENGLLFRWRNYGYFTGDESGRLPPPTRRHKRTTPEPSEYCMALYLQTYKSLQSDYEVPTLTRAGAIPIPSPIPNPKQTYAEFVSLTEKDYQNLVTKFGQKHTDAIIEKLNNQKGATGKTYKSDIHAIRNWVIEAVGAVPIKAPKPANTTDKWKDCPTCGYVMTTEERKVGKCESCREKESE